MLKRNCPQHQYQNHFQHQHPHQPQTSSNPPTVHSSAQIHASHSTQPYQNNNTLAQNNDNIISPSSKPIPSKKATHFGTTPSPNFPPPSCLNASNASLHRPAQRHHLHPAVRPAARKLLPLDAEKSRKESVRIPATAWFPGSEEEVRQYYIGLPVSCLVERVGIGWDRVVMGRYVHHRGSIPLGA